jgi:hypothetical protein
MAILNPYSKTTYVDGTTPDLNAVNLNKNEQGVYDVTEKVRELAAYETNAAASAVSAANSASAAAASAAVYTDLVTVVANHATYSTTEEIVIGTFDGKPLYRKAVLIPALSSVPGDATYNHGIANVEKIKIANGSYFKQGNNFLTIPFVYRIPTSSIGALVSSSAVTISVGVNQSSTSAVIFLEYTKTTD